MRVLQLLKTSVGATWALSQMRELGARGIDVHATMPEGPLVSDYERAGVTVHLGQFDLPVKRPWTWPAVAREFRRLVETVAPDVIHSHFVGTTLTMRLALGRRHPIPRVYQVAGPLHLEHALFRHLEIGSAGPRDSWIGSCQWTVDLYRRVVGDPERVFLTYYGTELDRFVPRRTGKLRRELGLASDAPVVGMVAYMYAPKRYLGHTRGLKGHEDLIDAAAICIERGTNLTCVFAGGPASHKAASYEKKIHDYARRRLGSRAVFLGTRNDVYEIYCDFDVAVHPSHSENVGGARESMLFGVPTVATNVGGFPDLVKHGETGWLVPAKSPEQLAAAIREVLSDPDHARRLGERGRHLARELFDIRNCASQMAWIYETVVRRHSSSPGKPGLVRSS